MGVSGSTPTSGIFYVPTPPASRGDVGDMCSCVFRVSSFAGEGGTLPFGMFPITLGRREFRASRTRRYLLLRATIKTFAVQEIAQHNHETAAEQMRSCMQSMWARRSPPIESRIEIASAVFQRVENHDQAELGRRRARC